jgi:hypothetical protein
MADAINISASITIGQKRCRSDNRAGPRTNAYEGFSFEPIASSGRPGTPHCYFEASYRVKIDTIADDATISGFPSPIIHRHANGLCIVTAGNLDGLKVESLQFLLESSAAVGQPSEQKKQKKRQGRGNTNNRRPRDALLKMILGDGGSMMLPCCVLGTVVEVNENITPELLTIDPLLDGYLAVIQPTGLFPPVARDCMNTDDKKANN